MRGILCIGNRMISAPRLVNILARRIEPLILKDKPAADVYKVALSCIADAQIVDAAPVIHAHWIFGDHDVCGCSVECSNCGYGKQQVNKKAWLEYPGHKFCGSCGAQMGGAEDGK